MNRLKHLKLPLVLPFLAVTLFVGGCQHIDVAQMAYGALRAEDCRRNQLDNFCSRTYAVDYREYVQLRNNFLRELNNE